MERVWPNTIQFADSEMFFAEYDWEAMEEQRDQAAGVTVEGGIIYGDEPLLGQACITCAHGKENAEFCEGAGYDCDKCTVMRCICKRCEDFNKWEPKGGAR
jgi:hypothetical protein